MKKESLSWFQYWRQVSTFLVFYILQNFSVQIKRRLKLRKESILDFKILIKIHVTQKNEILLFFLIFNWS